MARAAATRGVDRGKSAVTSDKLTRPELTWLLAQEARSAAQKLRQGGGRIAAETTPPPPATDDNGRRAPAGAMQTVTIPAEIDQKRLEVESLKKELAAAQAQGEAYARELAAVFTRAEGERERGSLANVVSRLTGSDPISHLPASGE